MVKRKGQYRKKRMSKNRGKTPISKRVLRRKSTKRKVKRSKKNKRKQRGGDDFNCEDTCDHCTKWTQSGEMCDNYCSSTPTKLCTTYDGDFEYHYCKDHYKLHSRNCDK